MNTLLQNCCRMRSVVAFVLIATFAVSALTRAADAAEQNSSKATAAKLDPTVSRGIDYLRAAQAEDGSYSATSGPGITAIVATALMRSGLTPSDPSVAKSLKYL